MFKFIILVLLLSTVAFSLNEEIPEDAFIPVEKQPEVDVVKLSKLVVYPDFARRGNVEGRVILKLLINEDGSILKCKVEYSDSQLLDQAAIDAMMKYGKVKPAIQNGKPVACWLSVPITFKLRDSNEKPVEFKIDYLSNTPLDNINEKNEVLEKAPIIDMYKLSKNIEYPLNARKKNIQGKVIVKVKIDKKGFFKNYEIIYSDSKILNNAALEAVKKYGKVEYPATKEGVPVECTLDIPITFRLR